MVSVLVGFRGQVLVSSESSVSSITVHWQTRTTQTTFGSALEDGVRSKWLPGRCQLGKQAPASPALDRACH